jgi:hypothetical protein
VQPANTVSEKLSLVSLRANREEEKSREDVVLKHLKISF